jgi:hypothetical protein
MIRNDETASGRVIECQAQIERSALARGVSQASCLGVARRENTQCALENGDNQTLLSG